MRILRLAKFVMQSKAFIEHLISALSFRDLKLDYDMYVKFWKLQDFFVTPNLAYNQEKWLTFSNVRTSMSLTLTITRFPEPQRRAGNLLNEQTRATSERKGKQIRMSMVKVFF